MVADLLTEMKEHVTEKHDSIPAMRSALAIAGFRALRIRIERSVAGKYGVDAVRATAHAMRSFALGCPGLAAASFRNPVLDSPEWAAAGQDLAGSVYAVFADAGITGSHAKHAVRILRSLVRGFILNEMASAASHPLEFQKSYNCAVEMFIAGLPTLAQTHFEPETETESREYRDVSKSEMAE